MSHICPNCSHVIPAASAFCTQCGYRLQGNEQVAQDEGTIRRSASLGNIPPRADPSATFTPGGQQIQPGQFFPETPLPPDTTPAGGEMPQASPEARQGGEAPAAPAPFFSAGPPDARQSFYPPMPQGSYPPAQNPGGVSQYMYQQQYAQPPVSAPQVNTAQTSTTPMFARAYAGSGTTVHHQSWLLKNTESLPNTLRTSLIEHIQKQTIPGLSAHPEHLSEQGSLSTEERDVTKIQFGPAAVFVTLLPMGQNLYVSRTSTVQQPLSQIRIFVLGGLFVLMLLSFLLYALINPTDLANAGFLFGLKDFFFYPAYGLLFFFIFLLIRSGIFWLTEKDFLVYLRPNTLNDFTLDTLASVEQITDKSIRETLSNAGLKIEEMDLFSQSDSPRQVLHRF